MILRFVLVPGKVYPRSPPQHVQVDSGSTVLAVPSHRKPHPGFQILATRRTIHNKGEKLFYSKNIFYLPHGSAEDAKSYFDLLLPRHSSLVRRIAIKCSITDLKSSFPIDANAELALLKLWRAKVQWACLWHQEQMRLGHPGLDEIILEEAEGGNNRLVLCKAKIAEFLKLLNYHGRLTSTSRIEAFVERTPLMEEAVRELRMFLMKAHLHIKEIPQMTIWRFARIECILDN